MEMRQDALRVWLLGALACGALAGCVNGLDFNEIAPQCDAPRFDALGRDVFCSGQVQAPTRLAPPDGERFIGADLTDERALLISAHATADFNGAPLFDQLTFHTFDPDSPPLSLEAGGSRSLTFSARETLSGAVRARLLASQGDMAGVAMINRAVLAQLDGGGEPFVEVPGFRYPPQLNSRSVIDIAAQEDGDRLLVFLAAADAGVKPLSYTLEGGRWVEELPQADRLPLLNSFRCATNCAGDQQNLCEQRCPDCSVRVSPECNRCVDAHCLIYPMELGAYSLTVSGRRLYVGGLGAIHVYDTAALDPARSQSLSIEDTVQGTVTEPRADRLDLPDFQGTNGNQLLVASVTIFDGTLYAILVDAEVILSEEGSPQPILLRASLDAGLFQDPVAEPASLSMITLPSQLRSTFFFDLLPMANDVLAIKLVDSDLTRINDSATVVTQGDVELLLLDLIDPAQPRVVFNQISPHNGERGTVGLGGVGGDNEALFTDPEGASVLRVLLEGEALP